MHIRKLLVALLMTFSLSAAADFITVEEGYEVALSDMTVPVTSTGYRATLSPERENYFSGEVARVKVLFADAHFAHALRKSPLFCR